MESCPVSVTRMVSLPNRLPDSPSAAKNIRSARQRSLHLRSLSPAAARW
ncbi:hypothetical protein SALBM311S_00795 [Streptomyces alboniger]